MSITAEPPLDQWRLRAGEAPDRSALAAMAGRAAERLGGAPLIQTRRVVATGHQAWLWHPGILAKDLAMVPAATRFDASMLHLVVDHDTHEALKLELPAQRDGLLEVETLHLASEKTGVPACCQPPADAASILHTLRDAQERLGPRLLADLSPLLDAFVGLPPCRSLAEQLTAALLRLMQPYAGPIPVMFATDVGRLPWFEPLVRRMLADARRCAACYNEAVLRHPEARVAPLTIEPDRVELPLWALGWEQPRRRVFADLSDRRPELSLESGETIRLPLPSKGQGRGEGLSSSCRNHLAPRAILLTALLRRWCCDLFIHGKGGGVYDRITQEWWGQWLGEDLAPMTVVSADLRLDFRVPVAEPADLARAVWWRHHLPHNVDRALPPGELDGQAATAVALKRDLLGRMDDDRDRPRRAAAFREIHRINGDLAALRPDLIAQAAADLEEKRKGLANHAVARKRDWCFALYPPEQIRSLAATLEDERKTQSRIVKTQE